MATRNIVPRATGEGQLGRSDKKWNKVIGQEGNFETIVMPGGSVAPVDDIAIDANHTWSAQKIGNEISLGGGGAGSSSIELFEHTIAMPAGTPTTVTQVHELSLAPTTVEVYLHCISPGGDFGYSAGEEIIYSGVELTISSDDTNIYLVYDDSTWPGTVSLVNKTTGVEASITDETNWEIVIRASVDTSAALPGGTEVVVASEYFESTPFAFSVSSDYVKPHSLSKKPATYEVYMVCTVAEFGYTIGEEVRLANSPAGGFGPTITADSVNINIHTGADAPSVIRSDTNVADNVTPANWNIVVKAYTTLPTQTEGEIWESEAIQITPTIPNELTFPHGLNSTPLHIVYYFECIDVFGDQGYVQGDLVMSPINTTAASGFSIKADTTNIDILWDSGIAVYAKEPGTSNTVTLDLTNKWRMYVKAYVDGHNRSDLPKNYLSGYKFDDITDGDVDFTINPGDAKDSTNAVDIKLDRVLNKFMNVNWTLGNGGGAKPASLTLASATWYHVFAIMTTTGYIDLAIDDSIDGTHIINDLGYQYIRRIGSVYCTIGGSGQIKGMVQHGDDFNWVTPELDFGPTGSGARVEAEVQNTAGLITLLSPSGISTEVKFNTLVEDENITTNVYFSDPATADMAPSSSAPLYSMHPYGVNTGNEASTQRIYTDEVSRIRARANRGSCNVRIAVLGFKDIRSK